MERSEFVHPIQGSVAAWRDAAEQLAVTADKMPDDVLRRQAYRSYVIAALAVITEGNDPLQFQADELNLVFHEGLDNLSDPLLARSYASHYPTQDEWREYICHRLAPQVVAVKHRAHTPRTWLELYREIKAGNWQHRLE